MIALCVYQLKTLFDLKTKLIIATLILLNSILIIYHSGLFKPVIEHLLFQEIYLLNYHLDTLFFIQMSIVLFIILLSIQLALKPNNLIVQIVRVGRLKPYLAQRLIHLVITVFYTVLLILISFIVLKQTPYYSTSHFYDLLRTSTIFTVYYSVLTYLVGQLFKNQYMLFILFVGFFFSTITVAPNQSVHELSFLHTVYQLIFPSIHFLDQHFLLVHSLMTYLTITTLLVLIGISHFFKHDIK